MIFVPLVLAMQRVSLYVCMISCRRACLRRRKLRCITSLGGIHIRHQRRRAQGKDGFSAWELVEERRDV
jgi:hypothetical protein